MRTIVRAASTAALGALAVSLLAVPGAHLPAAPAAPAVSLVAATASPAQQMLGLVNAERKKAGCQPVRLDSRLSAAATKYSQTMSRSDFFSHTGRDGSTFVSRIEEEGYPAPRSENIAAGNTTAQATMQQWMSSSSHRRNILDCSAEDMGIGVASSGDSRFGTYWTQEFGLGTS
jgi:uncharacterized protein YkwD